MVAADVPTLNQSTTGTASNVTGTVAVANGGTSATTAPAALTNLRGWTTTATAAGTTTLTNTSTTQQNFTGATTQTVVLPVTSTLALGWAFEVINNSTGTITVNSSGGNLVGTVIAGTTASIVCSLTSGTTAASWDFDIDGFATETGTGSVVRATSPTLVSPALGTPTALVGTNITGTASGLSIGGNAATATTATTATTANALNTANSYTGTGFTASAANAYIAANRTSISSGQVGYNWNTAGANIWWSYLNTSDATNTMRWYNSTASADVMTLSTSGLLSARTINASNGIYENPTTIATSYTISTNSNAMSAGPITINTGVTVTVPSGSSWVIV
jgi:hypothetical protein